MTYREFLEKIDRSYDVGDEVYIPEIYYKDEFAKLYNNARADGYIDLLWCETTHKPMMRILEKPNVTEDLATIYFG